MKHKSVYEKARKLINNRELAEENLDWAEDALAKLLEKEPECAWAYGLVSEIYYWRGEIAPKAEKLALFQDGVDFGEQGKALDENCLEANFWLAVNYGFLGQEKGSVALAYSLYQLFANTQAGARFAAKTRQALEIEQLKNKRTHIIVYARGYFEIYETLRFVQIVIGLPPDIQGKLGKWLGEHLGSVKKQE